MASLTAQVWEDKVWIPEACVCVWGGISNILNVPPSPLPPPLLLPSLQFFEVIVLPLFKTLTRVLPDMTPLQAQVQRNYEMWIAVEAKVSAAVTQSRAGADSTCAP